MKNDYNKTIFACFIGYIVQAIINNFVPLLFVTFQSTYDIPLSKITMLITINFLIQLGVDILSAGFVDKIGYRASLIIAHVLSLCGLVLLTVLPEFCQDAFVGILISVAVYAVGGGLLEVLVSPVVEACPTANKEKTMSFLHSFYCWGHVGVVLLSTLYFTLFGINNWKILAIIWALVPLLNVFLLAKAPIYSLNQEGEKGLTLKQLFGKKIFWSFMLMMFCAGASEQAVGQWASTFVEKSLNVNKIIGDLLGPMAFAAFMGLSRLLYGKLGNKLDLDKFMQASCILSICSYLTISLIPSPVVGLLSCAACGFSVGIMWPGTFSKAAASVKGGGTALFAMLALAGDLGCSSGPTLAGLVSSSFSSDLRIGILSAIIFPVVLLICLIVFTRKNKKSAIVKPE